MCVGSLKSPDRSVRHKARQVTWVYTLINDNFRWNKSSKISAIFFAPTHVETFAPFKQVRSLGFLGKTAALCDIFVRLIFFLFGLSKRKWMLLNMVYFAVENIVSEKLQDKSRLSIGTLSNEDGDVDDDGKEQ